MSFVGANDLYGSMWCHRLPDNFLGFKSIKILSTKGTEGAISSWVKIGSGYDPIMVTGAINGDDETIWDDLKAGVLFRNGHTLDRIGH